VKIILWIIFSLCMIRSLYCLTARLLLYYEDRFKKGLPVHEYNGNFFYDIVASSSAGFVCFYILTMD